MYWKARTAIVWAFFIVGIQVKGGKGYGTFQFFGVRLQVLRADSARGEGQH